MLYSDGSMGVERAGALFEEARKRIADGRTDPDVELLEVELVVVRTHGRPGLKVVASRTITCPTCGEEIYVEETTDGEVVK